MTGGASSRLLVRVADEVRVHPYRVLATLLVATVVLGVFATQRQTSGDIRLFATGSELAARKDLIDERFSGAIGRSRVQVVFDAGRADVLGQEPIAAAARVEAALSAAPGVSPYLADVERPVVSFATPIVAGVEQSGFDPEAAPELVIDEVARVVLADPAYADARALYSSDLDLASARARAGLLLVNLDPSLDDETLARASLATQDVIAEVDTDGVRLLPFNGTILATASADATARELPVLLLLSLLVISVILAFNYRTVSDVFIGLFGLVAAVVWMEGIAVLLGPGYAGVTGPFTIISNIAPVVFLGLGLDDAIQLTSRYREQRGGGLPAGTAAGAALVAVGGAIILTSATTMVGFLVNVSSPIPPVQDFGIYIAVGQLCATVIMLLLVTSARNVLDSRRTARARPTADRELRLAALAARSAVLSERFPGLVVAVALAVIVLGTVASFAIPTRFDRRDLLPDDSTVREAVGALDTLFGGDRNEQTWVLLEGDLATPAAANALLAVEPAVEGIGSVRKVGGEASIDSIAGLVAELGQEPQTASAARRLGWTGGGFAPDADVAGLYALARAADPRRAGEVLDAGDRLGVLRVSTQGGQAGATQLSEDLLAAVAPLRAAGLATSVAGEQLVGQETNLALTESGTNSIVLALLVSLLLLTAYFGVTLRRPLLGLLTMTSAGFVVGAVFATMWLLGIPYNGLTVTIASISVGVGVTFSIHMTYRTMQELERGLSIHQAVRAAVQGTGAALASSGATTVAGFGVLVLSTLGPIRQFGLVSSLAVLYTILAALFVVPSVLVLWGRRRFPGTPGPPETADPAPVPVPVGAAPAPPPGGGVTAGGADGTGTPDVPDDEWWAPPRPARDDDPTLVPPPRLARFRLRLEESDLLAALADPPDDVARVSLLEGGARFVLRDGRAVPAVFAIRDRQLCLRPASDLMDLVLSVQALPAGARLDGLSMDGTALVVSGVVDPSG